MILGHGSARTLQYIPGTCPGTFLGHGRDIPGTFLAHISLPNAMGPAQGAAPGRMRAAKAWAGDAPALPGRRRRALPSAVETGNVDAVGDSLRLLGERGIAMQHEGIVPRHHVAWRGGKRL